MVIIFLQIWNTHHRVEAIDEESHEAALLDAAQLVGLVQGQVQNSADEVFEQSRGFQNALKIDERNASYFDHIASHSMSDIFRILKFA